MSFYSVLHRIIYNRERKFNVNWLKDHSWMRYSVSKDAVYCVHCVLFGSAESKEKSFIAPISDWVNFSTYVKRHELSSSHNHNKTFSERYTSPDIQNEILQICASQVTNSILGKVKQAQFFAILADECTDKSTKEQLSICLRYLCKERDKLNSNEFAKGEMDKRTKLRTLCETRWSSRADALHTFKSSFSVVVSSLEALQADGDEKASARLGAILRFEFIIALIITDHILSGTVALSKHLQSVKCDLLEAVQESKTVIQMFMNERADDNVWDTLYNTAVEMAAEFDIEPVVPRQVRRQQNRANYQMVDPKQYWKVSLYFVFLDHLIGELQSRLIDSEGRFLTPLLSMMRSARI
ncbi:hypothetical protein KUTeg_005487 [Tegillarca granosa]|uniref:TTF-type domain-containing protein n=1 Tax=Tegillarca granosa TaxID=220873 RepID=A0ABQ9FJW2_TEGGR|nr:hypothetical protein KUTeg_005487 [Tegillarca granosa]